MSAPSSTSTMHWRSFAVGAVVSALVAGGLMFAQQQREQRRLERHKQKQQQRVAKHRSNVATMQQQQQQKKQQKQQKQQKPHHQEQQDHAGEAPQELPQEQEQEQEEDQSQSDALAASSAKGKNDSFNFVTIGTVSSVFKRKYGAPRQGSVIPSARGVLRMHGVPREALEGLEGYSHVWVSFVFHANSNKRFHARIEPPRLGGRKVGVYGTRTPHRINPLGLSVVKLDRVDLSAEVPELHVSGLDLIEGTPVLDVKPYHPADCVEGFTAPDWHANTPQVPFDVTFSETTERQLAELVAAGALEFYDSLPAIREAIRESAALDPRPVYLRKRQNAEEVYGYDLDRLNVRHTIDAEKRTVHIVDVHLWEKTREYKDI